MASSGSYHLKTNCTNVDVTSNLKQRRHGEAIRMQSKGLIANRSAYSSDFSAWIECFKNIDVGPCDLHIGPGQAHVDAEEMHAKIKQIEKDRNEKLRQFQQEVSERVRKVKRFEHKKELNKSLEKVEKETNVICQSAFPKKIPTARRNTCSFRSSISADKIKNIMAGEANTDASHSMDNVLSSVQEIDQKTQQIKEQSSQARACLLSKVMNTDLSGLPGGYWGQAKPQRKSCDEDLKADRDASQVLDQLSLHCDNEQKRQPGEILNDMWKGFDTERSLKHQSSKINTEKDHCDREFHKARRNSKEKRKIRFNLPETEAMPSHNDESHSGNLDLLARQSKAKKDPIVTNFGADNQIDKENKQQYWTYRKLFMDIDREKVREIQRRKNHLRIITRLKQEKETERLKMEKEVEVCIPNKNHEDSDGLVDGVKQVKSSVCTKQNMEKRKETMRYIDALKSLILQRVNGEDSRLPPICSCGTTLMETHPETCANNCVFYQNPKEFARVLSTVLATMDS
ncbi:uncharacterized protein LOC135684132 isoform X1 [Rhopilema esculentum]|uniref:uncharacterized protein LOC135684132 isoform X1 n=1 Tax=Rhopilema esculentum TaxID=499914 RepID=UPI0031DBE8F5